MRGRLIRLLFLWGDRHSSNGYAVSRTLTEKIESLRSPVPSSPTLQAGLKEKEGILVFETESLDHIDFNALLAALSEEFDWEQMEL